MFGVQAFHGVAVPDGKRQALGRIVEHVDHDELLPAVHRRALHCLPERGVAVAHDLRAAPHRDAVAYDPLSAAVEGDAPINRVPLFRAERLHVAGQAHHPQEGGGDGPHQPFDRVLPAQYRPDQALLGQHGAVQVGRHDGQLPHLVGVRGRGELAQSQERGLQPVPAGGAVFDDQPRHPRAHLPEEVLRGFDRLPHSLAQALRAVAAHADALVVVDLDVFKAVLRQRADDLLPQVVPHPGVAHVPEPPKARGDRRAEAPELVGLLMEGVGLPPAVFRLEPYPRAHAGRTDGLRRRAEAPGKLVRVDAPVPHVHLPALPRLGVPAAVDDKAVDVPPLQHRRHGLDPLLRRAAPGGAVFVEHHRQALRARQVVERALHHARQPVAQRVQAVRAGGQVRRGRLKDLPRADGLCPVAEVVVRQAAGQAQAVVPAVDLDLPGRRGVELHAPEHPTLTVLHGSEGEPPAHRHRADLPELLAGRAVPGPGGLELEVLDGLADQPPLVAPLAAQAVQLKRPRGVPRGVGRQPEQAEAGQHLERHGLRAAVDERRPHRHAVFTAMMGQPVLDRQAPRRGQGGDDGRHIPLPSDRLIPVSEAERALAVSQGVAVGEAEGKVVTPQPYLHQRVRIKMLLRPRPFPPRRVDPQADDAIRLPQPVAHVKVPEGFSMQ